MYYMVSGHLIHKECSGVVFRLDSPCENKGFLFVRFLVVHYRA